MSSSFPTDFNRDPSGTSSVHSFLALALPFPAAEIAAATAALLSRLNVESRIELRLNSKLVAYDIPANSTLALSACPIPASSPSAAATPATVSISDIAESLVTEILLCPSGVTFNSRLFTVSRISSIHSQLLHILHLPPSTPLASVDLHHLHRSVLPDPSADLHWDKFEGSIVRHFFARDPEAAFIVDAERSYTYGAIQRAAGTLARALIQGGVRRADVVTVYAYRGVDLVVAVMGVLAAGAVFSVIDPAYPPERQILYLKVAEPKAIVILAKAGQLPGAVTEHIASMRDLVVQIPALKIMPDDSVSAGSAAFDAHRGVAAPPDVYLGPDSPATLSFTSGSTGMPKGVLGRHYSLTHFFPWMGKTFNMDSSERFTMLSGIAHDPIQRDIFTPIFLGAQLHIPTEEDISTPGRLAEWMANSSISVTHLTPAMGQLLSAQATRRIPTLKKAFFVGDVLTKRDVSRLQSIAQNVGIVNMYGTTETQRAVSYFLISSRSEDAQFIQKQKNIMPAGKGMIDVQLLVVNRADRSLMCGVGETGEIYVRSSGLAEGYLDPIAKAEKFVDNWFGSDQLSVQQAADPSKFWLGARDRMYRSGDLGRYMPDGSVECSGRADDQIKLRGFRIELGEIDTHLSVHPAVRENVTLLRRDKDEEKILVSYFVPIKAPESDLEMRELITSMRDHLKSKLAAYAVPSLFVPLGRMPLNPNGKVDKPALPFPDTAISGAAHPSIDPSALTPVEKAIMDIWIELLPVAPPSITESFFDLGGHSILATRLIFELRKAFVLNAPLGMVFHNPSIKEQAIAIESLRQQDLGLPVKAIKKTLTDDASAMRKDEPSYEDDMKALLSQLPSVFQPKNASHGQKVFLTGGTGFLGAFILKDLLSNPSVRQVTCLVRAQDEVSAQKRVIDSCKARGAWNEDWLKGNRLQCVTGNLEMESYGLGEKLWTQLTNEIDCVIHNGALVHWVYPYSKLRAANVISTITALKLAASGNPKSLSFVSSTAVLESEYFLKYSNESLQKGGRGVVESDELEGSKSELTAGYGQSKWVAEKLVMECARRGLSGHIIRPGYIAGDSVSAVNNTDDFIWRLVKGCIQLGFVPDIDNHMNLVPVDYVAKIISLSATNTAQGPLSVLQVTARPAVRYNDLFRALSYYGWNVKSSEYIDWKAQLEAHVMSSGDNALFPLLHFVLDDLPTTSNAPELDDTNTERLLANSRSDIVRTVDHDLIAKYLSWLVAANFLEQPPSGGVGTLPAYVGDVHAIGRSGH